jgi:hypothetical protein
MQLGGGGGVSLNQPIVWGWILLSCAEVKSIAPLPFSLVFTILWRGWFIYALMQTAGSLLNCRVHTRKMRKRTFSFQILVRI